MSLSESNLVHNFTANFHNILPLISHLLLSTECHDWVVSVPVSHLRDLGFESWPGGGYSGWGFAWFSSVAPEKDWNLTVTSHFEELLWYLKLWKFFNQPKKQKTRVEICTSVLSTRNFQICSLQLHIRLSFMSFIFRLSVSLGVEFLFLVSDLLRLQLTIASAMEQSPSWEAKSHAASQDISCLYGTQRLITVFTWAHLWSLFWAKWSQ
jgi:hypothetical protein